MTDRSGLLLAAALACALLPAPGRADEIRVGMSAAFTGPSRGLGIEMYRGAAACFAEVNARGGVHGRPIRLIAYDDGYNPGPAMANTRQLIRQDKAFLLFGYVGTPTVTRVLPLLKRYEADSVYLFCPFTGAEPMRQPPYDGFVFHLRASYREETEGLVKNLVACGRKRIAVFYQIDAYGRSGWDGVRRALARRGLKMTGEATYRRGARFDQSMARPVAILRAGKPDAVICVGAYAACAAFIRDARDAGWDVPIANLSFVGADHLAALLAGYGGGRGRDYTAGLICSQVVPSWADTRVAAVRRYRAGMDRHAPGPPAAAGTGYEPLRYGFTSLEGYLSAEVVVELLRRLGPRPERGRIRATAEAMRDIDLGLGEKLTFSRVRHQGLTAIYFTMAEKSRFVPLTDWDRWKP